MLSYWAEAQSREGRQSHLKAGYKVVQYLCKIKALHTNKRLQQYHFLMQTWLKCLTDFNPLPGASTSHSTHSRKVKHPNLSFTNCHITHVCFYWMLCAGTNIASGCLKKHKTSTRDKTVFSENEQETLNGCNRERQRFALCSSKSAAPLSTQCVAKWWHVLCMDKLRQRPQVRAQSGKRTEDSWHSLPTFLATEHFVSAQGKKQH